MIVGASIPACPSVPLRPPPSPAGRGRYKSRKTATALSARASRTHRSVPGSTSRLRCPSGPASRGQNAGSVPGSLFVRRKGAWHRSHRLPRGAWPTPGTAPISFKVAWPNATSSCSSRWAIFVIFAMKSVAIREIRVPFAMVRRWNSRGDPLARCLRRRVAPTTNCRGSANFA